MVPKLTPRGTSFKGASAYLFHDKNRAETSERVAWVESVNLWTARPEDAWFEMMDTWAERASLKRAAGLPATGRDNTRPVLHLSLSWHPDEAPTPEQMKVAAHGALKALGLHEHQALIIAHKDEPHPHVHILANTVHAQTGKTANLGYSKETLSRWAEDYERTNGRILCEERVKNNERRRELRQQRAAEKTQREFAEVAQQPAPSPKPYEPVKDKTLSRPAWIAKQDIIDRMKALRAEQTAEHKGERDDLWQRHQAERNALEAATAARVEAVRAQTREAYRPRWSGLYRNQKAEERFVTKVATHPFVRACFVFQNRERLAGPGKSLSLRTMASLIVSPARLKGQIATMHERERQDLSRLQHADQKTMTDRLWQTHRASSHQVVERQNGERAAMRAHQTAERGEISFARAKSELATEAARTPPAPPREQFAKAQDAPQPAKPQKLSERIIQQMKETRAKNKGRDDFEREM